MQGCCRRNRCSRVFYSDAACHGAPPQPPLLSSYSLALSPLSLPLLQGTVNTAMLQTLTNFLFTDILVPEVNSIFGNGLPFPTVDGLALTNTHIDWSSGALTLATDFTFAPGFFADAVAAQADSEAAVAAPAAEEVAAPVAPVRKHKRRVGGAGGLRKPGSKATA